MKKTSAVLLALALSALLTPALCQAGEWTGWITDEHCAAKGANAGHKACADKCAKGGAKLVFYNEADETIYKLDDQELAKSHVGHEVKVSGDVADGVIKVKAIEPAAAE